MRPDLHLTAEQVQKRQRDSSRRTDARHRFIFKKALRWFKKYQPEVLESLIEEAYRKFPTQSGRRVKLDLAA